MEIQQIAAGGGWVAASWWEAEVTDNIIPKIYPAVYPLAVWALSEDGKVHGMVLGKNGLLLNAEDTKGFLGYAPNYQAAKESSYYRKLTKQLRKENGIR